MGKSRMTRACGISNSTRDAVFRRAGGLCEYCGKPGLPNAHFIPRSRGGLGIPQNILCLCRQCHHDFDFGEKRAEMRKYFRELLREYYPNWDEKALIYSKWRNADA